MHLEKLIAKLELYFRRDHKLLQVIVACESRSFSHGSENGGDEDTWSFLGAVELGEDLRKLRFKRGLDNQQLVDALKERLQGLGEADETDLAQDFWVVEANGGPKDRDIWSLSEPVPGMLKVGMVSPEKHEGARPPRWGHKFEVSSSHPKRRAS